MKPKAKSVKLVSRPHAPAAPKLHSKELVLGVDGGATKTRVVVVDAQQRVLGEGLAGPSNPLRIGVQSAVSTIREAIDRACRAARVSRLDVVAAEIGLAGVKREDIRERMQDALKTLGIGLLEVVTDADIALFGATGGKPGLVLIAGTGSVCCGSNARGKIVYAGGWGPIAGDEGSGSWIARRGLNAVARATDGRGPETPLVKAACAYFDAARAEDLGTAIYAPSMTHDRIAGFAQHVIEYAKKRDAVSLSILTDAGRELASAANAVIKRLHMEQESFPVGYVGGVFNAGELMLKPLRREVLRVAPEAQLVRPLYAPAEAAARMARAQVELALAG